MLYMYNESYHAWDVVNSATGGSLIRLTRSIQQKNPVEGVHTKTITMLFPFDPIRDRITQDKLSEKMELAFETEQPMTIMPVGTTIIFNKKEFNPFIGTRKDNYKDVLLGTIRLLGRRVVTCDTVQAYLLDFMIGRGEISFTSTLNELGSLLEFILCNDATGTLYKYRFTRGINGVNLEVVEEKIPEDKPRPTTKTLKHYRPPRPTFIILVKDAFRDKINILESEASDWRHEIIYYRNLEDLRYTIIPSLEEQGFRAVTFFSDMAFNTEQDTKKISDSSDTLKVLSNHFRTIFRLHPNGKVTRLKF